MSDARGLIGVQGQPPGGLDHGFRRSRGPARFLSATPSSWHKAEFLFLSLLICYFSPAPSPLRTVPGLGLIRVPRLPYHRTKASDVPCPQHLFRQGIVGQSRPGPGEHVLKTATHSRGLKYIRTTIIPPNLRLWQESSPQESSYFQVSPNHSPSPLDATMSLTCTQILFQLPSLCLGSPRLVAM